MHQSAVACNRQPHLAPGNSELTPPAIARTTTCPVLWGQAESLCLLRLLMQLQWPWSQRKSQPLHFHITLPGWSKVLVPPLYFPGFGGPWLQMSGATDSKTTCILTIKNMYPQRSVIQCCSYWPVHSCLLIFGSFFLLFTSTSSIFVTMLPT